MTEKKDASKGLRNEAGKLATSNSVHDHVDGSYIRLWGGVGVEQMKPLRILKDESEPTKAKIFLARLEQSWREWIGPSGKGWIPIRDYGRAIDTDKVLERSYRRTDEEK